jgi:predicted metal-dependent phosphoesterase TrpH
MMRADLHTHSVYSDGIYTPDEVCKRAKFAGVEVLSITDHDTMNGLEEKRAAAKKYGLTYVDGWEISAYLDGDRIHVLGYGCARNEAYQSFMQARVDEGYARACERVEKLNALGIPVRIEDVLACQVDNDSPLHTMHVARAVAKCLGITPGEAYVQYLDRGKAADSSIGRPDPYQALDCIRACGGVAFLAHPGRIRFNEEKKERLIASLKEYGLCGIECHYSTHTPLQTEIYLGYAKKYGLWVSGGSDTHWEEGTSRMIGSPVFYAGEELLGLIKARG